MTSGIWCKVRGMLLSYRLCWHTYHTRKSSNQALPHVSVYQADLPEVTYVMQIRLDYAVSMSRPQLFSASRVRCLLKQLVYEYINNVLSSLVPHHPSPLVKTDDDGG